MRNDLVTFARTMTNDELRASIAANTGIDRVAVTAARRVLASRNLEPADYGYGDEAYEDITD